jgi:hypothetical protein
MKNTYSYQKLTLSEKGVVALIIVPAVILVTIIVVKTMLSKIGDSSD